MAVFILANAVEGCRFWNCSSMMMAMVMRYLSNEIDEIEGCV